MLSVNTHHGRGSPIGRRGRDDGGSIGGSRSGSIQGRRSGEMMIMEEEEDEDEEVEEVDAFSPVVLADGEVVLEDKLVEDKRDMDVIANSMDGQNGNVKVEIS
jgi:hypothetical protein